MFISEKFKEYIFIDEEHDVFKGQMVRYRFPNGYGASVIEGEKSYGVEIVVLEFSESEYGDIATEFSDDVIGFIDDEELDEILERISRLGTDGQEKS